MAYVDILPAEHSVLLAGLCCRSTRGEPVLQATGLAAGVADHRFVAGCHAISDGDARALQEAAAAAPSSFPAQYASRCTAAAGQLLARAREAASGTGDLGAGLAAYGEAVQRVAPFCLLTPIVARALPGLREPPAVPEAMAEVRSCARIALAIIRDPAALEVFQTTAPQIALRRVEESFPALHRLMGAHIDSYGWLRTRAYRLAPPTPRELVDRLQSMVLRWEAPQVRAVAGAEPPEDAGEPWLVRRGLSGHVLLQAECLARPFFARIAEALSCTFEQVLFADAEELAAALGGGSPFPVGAVARRYGEGFAIYREGADLQVHTAGPRAFEHAMVILSGMTSCRGRAAGPVKIIRDEAGLDRLEVGDVLVTAASTTDWAGGPTVFPTRGGGPDAIGRAAAVVTDEGGLLSHAAVVCRERGIPCVLATERATELLSEQMVVEVDATQPVGKVVVLDPAVRPPAGITLI